MFPPLSLRRFAVAAFLLVAPSGAVLAHEFKAGALVVGHPWSRPTMPGMPMGVAYFTVTNNGAKADALLRATTPAAASVEMHETRIEDGVARMRPLTEIEIAPGATIKVQPGGIHLMLVDLKQPLVRGTRVPLTLEFRAAGKVTVELAIEDRHETAAVESEMTRSLGTIVVTARRSSSLPTYIPTTIEGISGERVADTINASDAEDALKYLPSLNVRKRFIGDYDHAVLATRASGTGNSARSLVYVDGILISNLLGNGASFTPRWGLVTPEEIERVDVLYGPFSAAYPGNSVGAVVDYVTRMPGSLKVNARTAAHSQDFELYGTRERYDAWSQSFSAGNRHGAFAWWFNLNRLDSRGHPIAFTNKLLSAGATGAGTPVTGALRERNPRNEEWYILGATNEVHTVQDHAKLKLAWDFADELTASYTFATWRNDATRAVASYLLDDAGNEVYSGPVVIDGRRFVLANTDFAPGTGELRHHMQGLSVTARGLGNADLTFAASRYDYARDRARSSTGPMPAALRGGAGRLVNFANTGWTSLALRGLWRSDSDAHRVDFGVGEDRQQLRSEVNGTTDWRRGAAGARISAFRGDTAQQSVYAQDTWTLARDWRATVGLRFERWSADHGALSNATNTLAFAARDADYLSPKAALAWAPGGEWSIKASLGHAVRNPTVSELFQGAIDANTLVNSDPDLAPERSWTSELSAERELAHGTLRLTGFHEDTRDALYSQTNVSVTPTVTSIQNIERIRTEGVEVACAGNGLLDANLDLTASLTWAHSRIVANPNYPASVGRWQPRVPAWRANAVATWRPTPDWTFTLGARYSGTQYNTLDNSDPNGNAYTGTSAFLVVDARARVSLGEHLKAAVGVDNLGNETYWAFHPYTQRTYSAELAVTL
jgi:iron complex outermembrane recepter protein